MKKVLWKCMNYQARSSGTQRTVWQITTRPHVCPMRLLLCSHVATSSSTACLAQPRFESSKNPEEYSTSKLQTSQPLICLQIDSIDPGDEKRNQSEDINSIGTVSEFSERRAESLVPRSSNQQEKKEVFATSAKASRRGWLKAVVTGLGAVSLESRAEAFPSPALEDLQGSCATSFSRVDQKSGINALRDPAIYRQASYLYSFCDYVWSFLIFNHFRYPQQKICY